MKNLNLIYVIPHFFGHKTQIQLKDFFVLQKKSLRINAHTYPLLRESNIVKLLDKIALENCLLIDKCFNKFLPIIFKN